jgi:hypothetical protein
MRDKTIVNIGFAERTERNVFGRDYRRLQHPKASTSRALDFAVMK